MLHFIYGPIGSGKTTVLLKYLEADIKENKKAEAKVEEILGRVKNFLKAQGIEL